MKYYPWSPVGGTHLCVAEKVEPHSTFRFGRARHSSGPCCQFMLSTYVCPQGCVWCKFAFQSPWGSGHAYVHLQPQTFFPRTSVHAATAPTAHEQDKETVCSLTNCRHVLFISKSLALFWLNSYTFYFLHIVLPNATNKEALLAGDCHKGLPSQNFLKSWNVFGIWGCCNKTRMIFCVCVAPISSHHSTSAGAVRSPSCLASQTEDVTAAASCPAAERLQIDYTHSLFISPLSQP